MRFRFASAATAALAFIVGACADQAPLAPVLPTAVLSAGTASLPAVRIAEIHYDNTGTDAGEAIEVSAPAGTDLAGWSLVLYNGSGGAVYSTSALSGVVADQCSGRGVVVVNYPSNGIQNGSPDGIALVDNNGALVEFLSYEGTFVGVGGAAGGVTSVDIGVSENGTEPLGQSLQRASDGSWAAPATATFGSCNDAGGPPPPDVATVTIAPSGASLVVGGTQAFTATATDAGGTVIPGTAISWSSDAPAVVTVNGAGLVTAIAVGSAQVTAAAPNGVSATVAVTVSAAPPPPPPATVRFSEIHYDNAGTDVGEAIEVEGPAGTDLTGWSIVLYNGSNGSAYNTAPLTGTVPNLCSGRGVVVVTYPSNGIQNGSPDAFALVNGSGAVVEFLSYEGVLTATDGVANGLTSTDIGVSESGSEAAGQSLQRDNNGVWQPAATASFGACYGGVAPPPGNTISFSGRTSSDPALPVGYEDQLFATVRDGSGNIITTAITWTSETPAIASVDANGVVRALAAGTFTVRATAADGVTTATYTLDTQIATAGGTAQYGNNVEFGVPADGDASDDILLARAEFTSSWNPGRGIPNWVSYNLEATHIGSQDRCDCFTFDPALPSALPRYTTADYTGAGAFAGYGIDRGHLARSFDRSTGLLDNANTFFFSNIIPQAADNNQGPWSALEIYLGDQARFQNKEVFVIAGASGNKGTVKGEGKITIPSVTWKVAVLMDRDEGLANISSTADLTVIAVAMPNDPGIRNIPWQTYETTVDAVEALSGYDLLALLPDPIEIAVESKTAAPVAATDGPYLVAEGSTFSLSGAGSSDPDGDALTYTWSFGDGAFGSGETTSHTYAQDGSYTVRLVVADTRGLADTVTTTATVSNVAPSVAVLAGATLLPGEFYQENGSFVDPGADSWTATIDYGDGSGVQPLALSGTAFALSHRYLAAGSYTVTVAIHDDDTATAAQVSVTVLTPSAGVEQAITYVQQLEAKGAISHGNAASLLAKLEASQPLLDRDKEKPSRAILGGVLQELDALEATGQIGAAEAAALRTLVQRVIASIAT